MDADQPQPDWSLLPARPGEFFALPASYEIRDLKRAYGALIRRFKPERFPEEFQRIRAAYETLERRLRYGDEAGTGFVRVTRSTPAADDEAEDPVEAELVLPAGGAESSEQPNRPPQRVGVRRRLIEALDTQSPAELYAQLREEADKRAEHYLALAVLADVAEPQTPGAFARWVFDGLELFPSDPSLRRMLVEILQSPVSASLALEWLSQTSRILRNEWFYSTTEPLWRIVARELPFDQVRRLLDECELRLVDIRPGARIVFNLYLVRQLLWTADDDWLEERFRQIDREFEHVPAALHLDWEILVALFDYRRVREQFLAAPGGSLRRELDELFVAYSAGDDVQFDEKYLDLLNRFYSEEQTLLEAFPFDNNAADLMACQAWRWIELDVEQRLGQWLVRPSPNPNPSSAVIMIFAALEQSDLKSPVKLYWAMLFVCKIFIVVAGYFLSFLAMVSLVVLLPISFSVGYFHEDDSLLLVLFGLLVVVIGGVVACVVCSRVMRWARDRIIDPLWNRIIGRPGRYLYAHYWRLRLLRGLRHYHLGLDEFRMQTLAEMQNPSGRLEQVSTGIAELTWQYSQTDVALALGSQARQFVA